MPRAKKTLSGEAALPAQAMKGGPYGSGERALESQRRTPMPDRQVAPASTPGGPAPSPGGQGGPDRAAALQEAMQMASPPSVLATPTERPKEDVTTGMTGRSAMPQTNEAYYELKALVQRYPYPDLVNLLNIVEQEM